MQTSQSLQAFKDEAAAWLASPGGLRLIAVAVVTLAGLAGFLLYETVALGWPMAREEPARFDAYHLLRSAFAACAAALLVAAIVSARVRGCALARSDLSGASLTLALAVTAGALCAVGVMILSPATFSAFAREDNALEWASAILLLTAAAIFAARAWKGLATTRRGRQQILPVAIAALLAIAFFVAGMEEVSWMQRVIGFGTPQSLAEVNWQGEFNLHNIQTDLSETIYYTGAALFLILFPLLRDVAPPLLVDRLSGFVPDRSVAAVSAPLVILTYGHWNLLPVQITSFVALFVSLAFARAAMLRANRQESLVFLALAAAIALGQSLVLLYGPGMADLPDATEYKELFIAIGFAWYALGVGLGRPSTVHSDRLGPA